MTRHCGAKAPITDVFTQTPMNRPHSACLSMTGYANVQREIAGGRVALEIRSVNSRYLDVQFRIPDELRHVEPGLRDLITRLLSRGKVECRVAWQRNSRDSDDIAPSPAAMQRLDAWQRLLRERFPDAPLMTVADILRWPGVLADQEPDPDNLREAILALAQECLGEFVASRAREGRRLAEHILERLAAIDALVASVRPRLPALREAYQRRVADRLAEALGLAAPAGTTVMTREEIAARLSAEAALFGMRSDVDEELSRLDTHVSEVRRLVTTPPAGGIGKRLDFLMQELNREANTLGSKAVAVELSQASIELKLLIEQMREQVQNLE